MHDAVDPTCPAPRHNVSFYQWNADARACICPGTLRALASRQRARAELSRAYRRRRAAQTLLGEQARKPADTEFDLRKADDFDVDSVLLGYRLRPYRKGTPGSGMSIHTEAALVLRMCQQRYRVPQIAEQISKTERAVERIKSKLRARGYTWPPPVKAEDDIRKGPGVGNVGRDDYNSWRYAA